MGGWVGNRKWKSGRRVGGDRKWTRGRGVGGEGGWMGEAGGWGIWVDRVG